MEGRKKQRCYYDILTLDKDTATSNDIKKSYRKLALKWHPDKHSKSENQEEAKLIYEEIQRAYEVLSDEQERAFYDSHREFILLGGEGAQADYGPSKLFAYFQPNCFVDFDDEPDGFYTVYREIFSLVEREEYEFAEGTISFPSFGGSDSDYTDVAEFYKYWSIFSTKKNFNWLTKYDISQADGRRVRRIVERENKKEADKGKKEFNDVVRKLCNFVKKRDPRVKEYLEKVRIEKEQNQLDEYEIKLREKEALKKRQELLEKHFEEFEDLYSQSDEDDYTETSSESIVEDNLYCILCKRKFKSEGSYKQHEKSKKHMQLLKELEAENKNMVGLEEAEEFPKNSSRFVPGEIHLVEADDQSSSDEQVSIEMEDNVENIKETVHTPPKPTQKQASKPVNPLYCPACTKTFKSEGSYKQHEKTKKHKQNLKRYNEIQSKKETQPIIEEESKIEVVVEEGSKKRPHRKQKKNHVNTNIKSEFKVHSEQDFGRIVEEAALEEKTIIVCFTAVWCTFCKRIAPLFANLSGEYPDMLFMKVDVDHLQTIAEEHRVQQMPTFKVIQNRKVVETVLGADPDKLRYLTQAHSPKTYKKN